MSENPKPHVDGLAAAHAASIPVGGGNALLSTASRAQSQDHVKRIAGGLNYKVNDETLPPVEESES